MTTVVEAEWLTQRFGEVSAVTDLSFALEAGAITGLLGPNGAVDDSLLFGLIPSVGRFTPTRASDSLMGLQVHHLVSPGAGAIVLIAWAGALAALGIARSARQDID